MDDLRALHPRGRMPPNPKGNQGMSVLDGLSECWWLSNTCSLDWDAVASVGTVAGVLVALFAPVVRRALTGRKVDTIFVAAHMSELRGIRAKIRRLQRALNAIEFDEDEDIVRLSSADSRLVKEVAIECSAFKPGVVDLARYPGLDLHLASIVTRGIYEVSKVGHAIGNRENGMPHLEVATYEIPLWQATVDRTMRVLNGADRACVKANQRSVKGWRMRAVRKHAASFFASIKLKLSIRTGRTG
ncbi:hypothetical protein JJL50_13390 [Stenotrophomonas maltophilia]|jgi:hypothetical protein|uniref:Uncharacterized protein n=1 Tax=Stenotrophomonas maltophilia TaxID=40324 RepID=A0ABD7BZE4_STEMA|nr:hypothetical protein [Stenotrophomonas maltophilia]QQQ40949.1 hypothetical protein JJL50_13390 [Stenotrophomonas maltophilia]